MSGVILQGKALKIVNKGGGRVTKTVMETVKDAMGIEHTRHRHYQSREKVKGSDYIIFLCPGCGKRNKRSAYEVKGRAGDSLSFRCNGCYREIEVERTAIPNTIVMVTEPPRTSGKLLGPDGREISR
jgi:hypothetical protein